MQARPVPPDCVPAGLHASDGLTTEQVVAQRQVFGSNDIVAPQTAQWQLIARDTAKDPMLWFLVVSASLFALLGHLGESLILLLAILPLLGMDFYLHQRTAASSAGLSSRLASTARVCRDGQWQDINSVELVPGDLIEVMPGQYYPADGVLLAGASLQSDESTLTGESLPVHKQIMSPQNAQGSTATGVSESCWGFAGTRLLTGTARLRVIDTGPHSRYGAIVRSATFAQREATPLQQAIGHLVMILLGVTVLICALLAGVRLWQGHGWIDALLSAVTLAVAAIPEEFPVVYTFFLGAGVYRLARHKTLVRRAVAVENIGRTSCIVSDKTGTITAGSLVLIDQVANPALPDALSSDHTPLGVATRAARSGSGDPLDDILHQNAGILPAATLRAVFPFTEARRRETMIWTSTEGQTTAYTKGAPETILDLCELSDQERSVWLARVQTHADSGHKVIACAWQDLQDQIACDQEPVGGFQFAGLLAFEDPVRDGVREAIAQCMKADMRVVMVTGDHHSTARAIAREIGLGQDPANTIVMAPDDDPVVVLQHNPRMDVVARATPTQKHALVKALQAQGELVAVTGDGVNDVPALRQADIGIAMGERGTQSAREVAPVVLLDDNFRTIVQAIAQGRDLFAQLRLSFAYLLLIHIPLVLGASLIPLMGLPLLFLPIHIVWLELIIHPTAMLAFQIPSNQTELAKVTHHRSASFYTRRAWIGITGLGALVTAALVMGYLQALDAANHVEHARAMAMAILLAGSAGYTIGLTRLKGLSSKVLVAGTLGSMVLAIQTPALSSLLGMHALHAVDWLLVVIALIITTGLSMKLSGTLASAS